MVDSRNNYAKYLITIEYPSSPKLINKDDYDFSNPQNVRKYADDLEEYNKAMEKYDTEVEKFHAAEKAALAEFEKDLTEKDVQAGISKKAIKKIFSTVCELVEYRGKRSEWLSGIEERYKDLIEVMYM